MLWQVTITAIHVQQLFFVEDGKARLVVKRESYEDMIRNEIL